MMRGYMAPVLIIIVTVSVLIGVALGDLMFPRSSSGVEFYPLPDVPSVTASPLPGAQDRMIDGR